MRTARIEILRFRPRHLERILKIERACFPEEPYTRTIFRKLYSEAGELFVIARLGSRVAGYMVTCTAEQAAEVISLGVDPAYRRRGVAAALLDYSLDRLAANGVRVVELMVSVENAGAIRFYRRFGFRRVREVAGYYGRGHAGLAMRRGLPARPRG
jgi:ribosomal-protein-alanine N-acetyltransferase